LLLLAMFWSVGGGLGLGVWVWVLGGWVVLVCGQAIEVIAITMSVYLAISISISLLMNWYNKRIALIER
jgi:general L-amino acid transport system permease protein